MHVCQFDIRQLKKGGKKLKKQKEKGLVIATVVALVITGINETENCSPMPNASVQAHGTASPVSFRTSTRKNSPQRSRSLRAFPILHLGVHGEEKKKKKMPGKYTDTRSIYGSAGRRHSGTLISEVSPFTPMRGFVGP